MTPIDYKNLFEKLIDQALDSEEIQRSTAGTELVRNFLQSELRDKSDECLSQVALEIKECEERQNELERAQKLIEGAPVRESLILRFALGAILPIGSFLFLLLIGLLIGKVWDVPILSDLSRPLPTVGILVAGFLILGGFFSLKEFIEEQVRKSRAAYRQKLAREHNIHGREESLKQALMKLGERLLHGPILHSLREIISSKLGPSYSTELRTLADEGLSDVYNPEYAVETNARKELTRLIHQMRGGTIGISGPRGSGKTTLLRWFCKPDLPNTPIEQRTMRIEVSAPVQYDVRDFILHLFSVLCYAVLDSVGLKRRAIVESQGEPEIPTRTGWIHLGERLLPFVPAALLQLSVLFFALSFVGFWTTPLPGVQPQQEVSISGTTSGAVPQTGPSKANPSDGVQNAGPSDSSPAEESQPATAEEPSGAAPSRWIGLLQTNKGELFRWGIYSSFLGFLTLFARPFLFRLFEPRPRRGPRTFDSLLSWARAGRYEILQGNDKTREWMWAAERAYNHLLNIHFQQSFSAGWKGSLNVPFLSADRSEAESFATKQQSLPDVVSEFCNYVTSLPGAKPVVIAIDEMDKMESPEQARQFLNDIKAIFGVPDCIYLVSVSESARSSFERRGLPGRDVFDSSFHEVFQLKYLDTEESIKVLNGRVIGLPIPFHGLCHCLSGGLARDLIRCSRKLVLVAASAPSTDLPTLTHEMIRDEITSKVDALQIAVKNLNIEPELSRFLSSLRDLSRGDVSRKELLSITGNLWGLGASRPSPSTELKEQAAQRDFIAELARELGAYIYYLVTVEELFAGPLNNQTFERGSTLDQLASARQELAVSPRISLVRITQFRQNHVNMSVPSWAQVSKEGNAPKPDGENRDVRSVVGFA